MTTTKVTNVCYDGFYGAASKQTRRATIKTISEDDMAIAIQRAYDAGREDAEREYEQADNCDSYYKGCNDGCAAGYDAGHDAGYDEGYDDGYNVGRTSNEEEVPPTLSDVEIMKQYMHLHRPSQTARTPCYHIRG